MQHCAGSDAAAPLAGHLDVVVTTAPGRIGLLRDALYSVAALTHPSVSAIVVVPDDDGACAEEVRGLCAHLSGLLESRVVSAGTPSAGRARARNAGLDSAAGEYVCFLDDGDVLYPQYASVLTGEMSARPQLTAVYGAAVRSSGRVTAHGFVAERKSADGLEPYDRARMLLESPVAASPPVYRLADLRAAGIAFDEDLAALEEWALLRRLSRRHELAAVSREVSEQRAGGGDALGSGTSHPEARAAIGAATADLPISLTEDELRSLMAAAGTERARVAALSGELAQARAELEALRTSPVLRLYGAIRRTGLHRPLRAAYRLSRPRRDR